MSISYIGVKIPKEVLSIINKILNSSNKYKETIKY